MRGAVGSLNAAVAGSILLFEAVAQRDPGAAPRCRRGGCARSVRAEALPERRVDDQACRKAREGRQSRRAAEGPEGRRGNEAGERLQGPEADGRAQRPPTAAKAAKAPKPTTAAEGREGVDRAQPKPATSTREARPDEGRSPPRQPTTTTSPAPRQVEAGPTKPATSTRRRTRRRRPRSRPRRPPSPTDGPTQAPRRPPKPPDATKPPGRHQARASKAPRASAKARSTCSAKAACTDTCKGPPPRSPDDAFSRPMRNRATSRRDRGNRRPPTEAEPRWAARDRVPPPTLDPSRRPAISFPGAEGSSAVRPCPSRRRSSIGRAAVL